MAYHRRRPQTPAQKRLSGILFMVLGAITLIVALSANANFAKMKNRCTAQEIGKVVDVEYKTVRSGRTGSHTEYRAKIQFDEGTAFGSSSVSSEWTRKRYSNGSAVRVYYDPNDTSLYYVDGAAPDSGVGGIILAVVFFAVGLITFKTAYK